MKRAQVSCGSQKSALKKNAAPIPALQKSLREASLQCGKILKDYFSRPLQIKEKKDAGLVTQADVMSETQAMKILRKAFPGCAFLAEESGQSRSDGKDHELRFIIDPLDGTTNFVHRFPMFCFTAAAEWRGEVVAAATYHPILGDLWEAQLGRGATLNGKKIFVSKTHELKNSLLTTGFTYRQTHHLTHSRVDVLHTEMQAFEGLSRIARAIRRPGSAALDLAYVACGVFDGFWERGLSPWDTAAGSLLVKEAGGCVTDFSGAPFEIAQKEILAAPPQLHELFRERIAPEFCLI